MLKDSKKPIWIYFSIGSFLFVAPPLGVVIKFALAGK